MDHEVQSTLSFTLPLTMSFTQPLTPTVTMSFTLPLTAMNLHAVPHLSDEKWFYGLVARTFAKACESLGIKKQSFSCQYKSHINKVMGHGTVGYCFDSDPEQHGGIGYLIQLLLLIKIIGIKIIGP